VGAGQAHGQKSDINQAFLRTNPTFQHAFHDVLAGPAQSTVRVLGDNKDAALGLIVGRHGWILTKATALKGSLTCKLRDGRAFEARLVGTHTKHDLALLKIEASGLTPVLFADSTATDAGSWVACAGLDETPVGFGVVSVAARDLPAEGGPILSPDVGYLGVSLAAGEGGVRIMRVLPKTGAEKAGLKTDDVIIFLAGKKVAEPEDFKTEMQAFRAGDVVILKVKRGDENVEVKATLSKAPPSRGEIQNRMGSELSSRRSGYPTILQFDGVIKPADCGGPLVNLEGKVIGISIARAGRTENWAVPSEVIRPVLLDLMVAAMK
jgi:serine protease Do